MAEQDNIDTFRESIEYHNDPGTREQYLDSYSEDLVTLDGGHFDAYVEKFEESSGPARDWFVEHLEP